MKYLVLDRGKAALQINAVFQPDMNYQVMGRGVLRNNIKVREAVLPEVRIIEEQSFYNCTSLRTVSLDQVTVIKKEAFSGCSQLRKIEFPVSLKLLGKASFCECKRLREVIFDEHCGCESLPEEIFSGCKQLEKVELPRRLRVINGQAFCGCQSLQEISFPNTLRKIGRRAFKGSGLVSLDLPQGLLTISDEAFSKCRSLEYVRVPGSVRKIDRWAFHGCSQMKVLEIHHDLQEIGEWITNKSCTIRCNKGSRMEDYAKTYDIRVEYL